ncbi:cobalamin-dependent protein [Candidatus Woesearchaeota archaeon]|nr:cobalamin-dependent protein [Candidatus Woesearchaeota archaeon]
MTSERLLLINPPFPRKVAGVPLQLLYLAAATKNAGIETQLLDLDVEEESSRESILEKTLKDYKPTHVGVTSYSPNYPESLDILKTIKRTNPSIVTISGGPHEIAMNGYGRTSEFIDHRITSTFGENDLLQLLGLEKRISNRETLFPAFELIKDHPQYQFDSELFGGRRMTQILTATGCNQKCDFCSAQQEYIPFRKDTVAVQLEKLIDLGYKAVFFNDPNFTNPYREKSLQPVENSDVYRRIKDLMCGLIDLGINQELVWGCQTKATMVNPELLDLMADAGNRYITYALENVDKVSLIEMVKGITPEKVQRAIDLSKERGIKTGLYVMLGTKKDKEEDFEVAQKTLDFVEVLQPNYLSISILANYPMLDRSKPGERKHMQLDYANQRYSREPIWLGFDEGWGAYHPNTDVQQATRYKQEIDKRTIEKPNIWNKIRRF